MNRAGEGFLGQVILPLRGLVHNLRPVVIQPTGDRPDHGDGDHGGGEGDHGSGNSDKNNNNNDDDDVDDDGGGIHLSPSTSTTMGDEEDGEEGENNGGGGRSVPASRVGAGAAAKGRAGAALPPGFAAARAGDLEGLKKLVEGIGGDKWDPTVAVDKNGSSPLDWAAGEGRVEVCRWVRGLGGSTVAGLCVVCGSVCRCDW